MSDEVKAAADRLLGHLNTISDTSSPYWRADVDGLFPGEIGSIDHDAMYLDREKIVSEYLSRHANDDENALPLAAVTTQLNIERQRADNHWETLRSIREIAKSGDCERIVKWVNDAGSGYVESAETTMSSLSDEIEKQRQRADDAERRLAEFTADANRYIVADDKIGEVCLAAGFDCESTLEAVQAMAAKLAEVTAERDRLADEIDGVCVALVGGQLSDCVDETAIELASIVKNELAALKASIGAAPVFLFEDNVRTGPSLFRDDETGRYRTQYKEITRVRLLPDPEPEVSDEPHDKP